MKKNMLIKVARIFIICSLLIVMSILIYKKTINVIYVEGTVNVIDDEAVVTFNLFDAGLPSKLKLPNDYSFPEGSKVECVIKTTTVFDFRYFNIKDVSLVN